MANKEKARDNLKLATNGMSSDSIASLSLTEVNAMVDIIGLSSTFVKNMQQSLINQVKYQELQEIADDIVIRLKSHSPDVAAIPQRGRIIKVWLDGKPEEIEL